MKFTKFQIVVVICFFPSPGCAPFPPCSPLTFVNKLIESNNFSSDLHPYYPIPPCQYQGGTLEALAKNDLDAVFIEDIPRHIMYEAAWVAGTGIPRLMEVITGNYDVQFNKNILSEIVSNRYVSKSFVSFAMNFISIMNNIWDTSIKW